MTTTHHDPRRGDADVVKRARTTVVARARDLGFPDLADDAALVVSELLSNALLHGQGCRDFTMAPTQDGIRVEVRDHNQLPPVVAHASVDSLTGRGVRLLAALSSRWGARPEADGKVVWAEITRSRQPALSPPDIDLAAWDMHDALAAEPTFRIELGEVPTDLLLAAKSHVDSLVREFSLASAGAAAGLTDDVPAPLASLLRTVVDRFAGARLAIKHQALEAERRGADSTSLVLELPASSADAAEEYLAALDEVDVYCRAKRLLTLETPPQHAVFRQWYIGELVTQLRAAAQGDVARKPEQFVRRALRELDHLAAAQRASDRAARLYAVAAALAAADTPEAVASAVLNEGVAALGAFGGGILLATDAENLALPGAVGYDEDLVAKLRTESREAELPAAMALRTGEAVWLESREERDRRFPELVGLEARTISLCAVPLEVQSRRLGALRFSFATARLFDADERRFVRALAAQAAQALERAQLQHARMDASQRLQRSLLPPTLPDIGGLDVAALYHPFGDGIDVGGDFYDVWQVGPARWAIAIGDSAGTGPEAAGMTALVRHTLRALAMVERDPRRVMTQLNSALVEATSASDEDRFCTAVFGVITPAGEGYTLDLAGGGHPPMFVRRADGSVEQVLIGGGLLGMFADEDIGVVTINIRPHDIAVFVTDGVIEARNGGDMFDVTGVQHVLSSDFGAAHEVVAALESAVLTHTSGDLTDDVAAVALRVGS